MTTSARPIASVLVETGLAHLDRPFDYLIPDKLREECKPGVRVRVTFAGRACTGYVVGLGLESDAVRTLAPLGAVVSPQVVLTKPVLDAATQIAQAQAGAVMDVLRMAIPPRHAAAEKAMAARELSPPTPPVDPGSAAWQPYPSGPAFISHLREGGSPWGVWLSSPHGDQPELDWPAALIQAAAATLAGGRGSILVVPDQRDLARLAAAAQEVLPDGSFVVLNSEQGPQARYTAWLKVLRGDAQVVIGTRSAAWAPVQSLGLLCWWDDPDDLHLQPRAPYGHIREVMIARARTEGAALLAGGFALSTELARVMRDEAIPLIADQRPRTPRMLVAGQKPGADERAARAHIPSDAWQAAKDALASHPVLIQVPRRGYVPGIACQSCRTPARCPECSGPLALPSAQGTPTCRWCNRAAHQWSCFHCRATALRANVIGASRTAEELGRAFPGVPVITSSQGQIVAEVPAKPALVIATPGAEPVAAGGYGAVLLLDAWALLDRPGSDAPIEALRRWLGAAALARTEGGVVVLAGAPTGDTVPAVEALVRWAPSWLANRELADRAELNLPPASWSATVSGARQLLVDSLAQPPAGIEVIGPSPAGDCLVRASWADGQRAADWLRDIRRQASARKSELITVKVGAPL